MRTLTRLFCLLVFASNFGAGLRAQQVAGSIRGAVADASGGMVSGAAITAKQAETGFTRSATSDAQGKFIMVELPVGHYSVQVEANGFQKFLQEGITLDVNGTASIAARLAIGTATQQIEVKADAPIVESISTNLGQTVGEREVLDLPLNGRHFTQLGLLQSGVVPITPGLVEAGGTTREGQAYAVNGQRPESNNYLLDGAANVDSVNGGYALRVPVDSVSEFRILTLNAPAEYGDTSGATTSVVTKSGSNGFHGDVYQPKRSRRRVMCAV